MADSPDSIVIERMHDIGDARVQISAEASRTYCVQRHEIEQAFESLAESVD